MGESIKLYWSEDVTRQVFEVRQLLEAFNHIGIPTMSIEYNEDLNLILGRSIDKLSACQAALILAKDRTNRLFR